MKLRSIFLFVSLAGAAAAQPATQPKPTARTASNAGQPATQLKEIIVTDTKLPEGAPLSSDSVDIDTIHARSTDSASMLKNTPGAAILRNGPQTGIVQLRGLSGDRVKVSVDGAAITPACPNHMDPPLHYAARGSVDSIAVMAGLNPVSQGGDNIAGTIVVRSPDPRFATAEQHSIASGELGSFFRGSNDAHGFNLGGSAASEALSGTYQGSWEHANELRFNGGRVRASGYETQQHQVITAMQLGQGILALDTSFVRTRDSGTPTLPMDMIKDDGVRVGLRYVGQHEFGTLEARAYVHTIDHLMNNYSLRPLAVGTMPMQSPATSNDYGFSLGVTVPQGRHTLRAGTDFHRNEFDASQQNMITGASQDTLNNTTRTRWGSYVEWQTDWSDEWTTQVGVRNDTVFSDAANVTSFFGPAAADARAFNARNHSFTNVNFDAVASLRYTPNDWSTYELGFARKNRAPSLLERYLWTPLGANAGLADGRTYLGNPDLDTETSYQIAFTADYHGEKWQVKTTPFYNIVHDYIQGVPIARLAAGRPVLQYQNVDRADLYGIDSSFRYAFTENFGVRGNVSYVRGINRSNDDNLYRIAPLHGSLSLDSRIMGWKSSLEVVLVAEQNKVAAYNGEPTTSGYALLNLRLGRDFSSGLGFEVGMENVTNERYTDHLGGLNRVLGSDVGIGQRIPGAGRFVYAQLKFKF
ncbi:MAG: TonB-dependent receptor [Prosthecobacter sp.]